MAGRSVAAVVVIAALMVPVLFDVSLEPQFSLPRTVQRADAAQEARYENCMSERIDEATRHALVTADNPDVQSLMIRMRQKEAIAECRSTFPQVLVESEEPLRIRLLKLRWRFGGGRDDG